MFVICKTRVQVLLLQGIIPSTSMDGYGRSTMVGGWYRETLSLPSIPNPFHLGHVFILGNISYLPLAQSSS